MKMSMHNVLESIIRTFWYCSVHIYVYCIFLCYGLEVDQYVYSLMSLHVHVLSHRVQGGRFGHLSMVAHLLHDLWTDNRSRVRGKVRGWVQFYTCLMGNTLLSTKGCPQIQQPMVAVMLFIAFRPHALDFDLWPLNYRMLPCSGSNVNCHIINRLKICVLPVYLCLS